MRLWNYFSFPFFLSVLTGVRTFLLKRHDIMASIDSFEYQVTTGQWSNSVWKGQETTCVGTARFASLILYDQSCWLRGMSSSTDKWHRIAGTQQLLLPSARDCLAVLGFACCEPCYRSSLLFVIRWRLLSALHGNRSVGLGVVKLPSAIVII